MKTTPLLFCLLAALAAPLAARAAETSGLGLVTPVAMDDCQADGNRLLREEPAGSELLLGDEPCECCRDDHWFKNLSLFAGLDGSKQPQDLGVNAHMGSRAHLNLGLPLSSSGLGLQIGTGVTYHDFAVGVVEAIHGRRERFQSFTTLGVFQRTCANWNWGVVYDFLNQNYYEGMSLGQWRGLISLKQGERNEFGVWFTIPEHDDTATFLGTSLRLKPIGQANGFWRRRWESGGETTFWIGAAEPHGDELIIFPPAPGTTGTQVVYGADIHLPLNDRLAVFGEANFITPSDSGTVDAYLGAVFYPWGSAGTARRRCYAPLLPVAGNPTFAVDLRR